jgi:hypothetical protein
LANLQPRFLRSTTRADLYGETPFLTPAVLCRMARERSPLSALAIVIGFGAAAHSGCATSGCPILTNSRRPRSTLPRVTLERRIGDALEDLAIFNARALKVGPQETDATLERRIENALKDLESATAHIFKADQKRLNESRVQNWN